ncbi:HopJ type III effector protein [Vibrio kasasachensis]|uniref:HopJ type III effector protein n=1 Tax=Vibrio kasasachensis TaxID=2910248 RepID=UPI003D0DC1C0
MELKAFLERLQSTPTSVEFSQSIAVIEANYTFKPTAFSNGTMRNPEGENNGSCKILAFGLMHKLSEAQTLQMFGEYYRDDVLGHPEGHDHQNIRNFIAHGWQGVKFEGLALI